MSIIQLFVREMDQEAKTTYKMLERVPTDKFDWQPHPKSMTIRRLVSHIGHIPSWVSIALATDELDFANNPYPEAVIDNTPDLLAYFKKNLAESRAALEKANEADLQSFWTLRNGSDIFSVTTKAEVIRMSYSQTVHHRAQLGVFLRLLDVPIPGSYGPSADEMRF
jgi:uncharacterized damage-inducible protein DinB